MKKPTVEIATASKPLIDELRAMDTHNRHRKAAHVEYLRREIREGRFSLTNQGIGVTVDNVICDGGQRLEAIALENYPAVQFILARNLPADAAKYVDLQAKRSVADILTLFFDQNISARNVAALNVCIYVQNNWDGRFTKVPPDRVIEEFQKKEDALKAISTVENCSRVTAAVFAAFIDAYHRTESDRVLDFMRQVTTGEMLQVGDPTYTLRAWFAKCSSYGGTAMQKARYLKTSSALNAFMKGRPLTRVYAKRSRLSA